MNTITPFLGCFSISSEILIHFGLTFFMVLIFPADAGRDEVLGPFRKVDYLIAER